MSFQSEVNSNIQALGNAGQIAKGHHSYCNIIDYVAGDNINVGEFAQSVANNDNEAKSTAGKQVTGSILGVVVKDRLKAVESAEPSSVINAGEPLQIINIGSVFIKTKEIASVGDYVIMDKTSGRVYFSATRPSSNSTINTGWRVFIGNDYAERGIVGITTSNAKGVNVVSSPYSAGDLVMKDLSVIKAAEVTAGDAANALGVLVFTEGKTALITNLEYDTNRIFCANPSSWWNNTVARRPESHAASNGGGNSLGWWEDYMPYYRAAAIAGGKVDDLDDSAKYPAFHAAIAKGEGWFVPNLYALVNVMNNSGAINATLNTIGKTQLTGEFWAATPINVFGLYFKNFALSLADRLTGDVLQKAKENDLTGVNLNNVERTASKNVLAVKAVNLK